MDVCANKPIAFLPVQRAACMGSVSAQGGDTGAGAKTGSQLINQVSIFLRMIHLPNFRLFYYAVDIIRYTNKISFC